MALLLAIVFSCTCEKDLPGVNAKSERKAMMLTFRDNNSSSRIKLFEYALIRFLWERCYIRECHTVIVNYIRFIRSQDQGFKKYSRLMEEMAQIENIHSFNMIPTSAQLGVGIDALTPNEFNKYKQENCVRNKKKANLVVSKLETTRQSK